MAVRRKKKKSAVPDPAAAGELQGAASKRPPKQKQRQREAQAPIAAVEKKQGKQKRKVKKKVAVTTRSEVPAELAKPPTSLDEDVFSKKAWKSALADANQKLLGERAAKEAEKKEKQLAKKRALEEAAAERSRRAETEKRQVELAAVAAAAQKKKERSSAQASDVQSPKKKKRTLAASQAVQSFVDTGPGSAYRQQHAIVVNDASCPAPIETFDALGSKIPPLLVEKLLEQGYNAPTPIQAQAWPVALQHRDLVAVAETGSGKTCGFLLPALARIAARGFSCPVPRKLDKYFSEPALPSALVLTPTRELAQQIAAEAEKFAKAAKARIVCIYGGVAKGEHVRELKQGADVLIATPGRMLDFATPNAKQEFKVCVSLSKAAYVVLDEADRMLDMGFEPDVRKIVDMCPKPVGDEEAESASRQTLFFTATWPKGVQEVAASLTRPNALQIRIGQTSGNVLTANKNVTQIVKVVPYNKKLPQLVKLLKTELKSGQTAIVFAATKGSCDYLERNILKEIDHVWVSSIHGNKDQAEREEALQTFRQLTAGKDDKRGVLVATDVAARGLDIPGVPMVVVYDFSDGRGQSGEESYVHRIGRTGRAGQNGRAFVFFSPEEAGAPKLVKLLRGAGQEVPAELAALADRPGRGTVKPASWHSRSSWW